MKSAVGEMPGGDGGDAGEAGAVEKGYGGGIIGEDTCGESSQIEAIACVNGGGGEHFDGEAVSAHFRNDIYSDESPAVDGGDFVKVDYADHVARSVIFGNHPELTVTVRVGGVRIGIF